MSSNFNMPQSMPVIGLDADTRSTFITRTYMHLAGAILGFTLIEMFLFSSGIAYELARFMLGGPWLLVLGAFMLVAWIGSSVAHRAESPAAQYAALAGYVVAEAIIFVPLLVIAEVTAPGVIQSAASVTIMGFIGLSAIVFYTRKDFSFMNSVLMWAGIVALILIVASVLFGFELGTWFSVAMIGLAGGAILRDTSNVLMHYPEDRYVAAALSLFASVALLFWYVLRLFLQLNRR
ncbi:MAG: Bax inhibitor-1 family protein [Caldilineaceae bacterium]